MAGAGGVRPGAGRKRKAEEAETQAIACKAIIKKFGGEEQAFMWLIETKEPTLIKFAFEHAFGKATEKIQHSGEITQRTITGMEIK